MKFHAVALCVAGALAACPVAAQEYRSDRTHTDHSNTTRTYTEKTYTSHTHADGTALKCEVCNGSWIRTENWPYFREVLWPDMPSAEYVASRAREMNENNRKEASELRALATRARSDGFQNIAAIYDHLAADHDRGAQFASTWLASNNFSVPAEPTITLASDMTPTRSIDYMIDHHVHMFNQALDKRQGEKSATVRGMLLMTAATSLRHISLLRALDRDVDMGRRTTSAYLQGLMENRFAVAEHETWIASIIREDNEYFAQRYPNPNTVIVELPVETPQTVVAAQPAPQTIERIVEVEKIVERPIYVERLVERPIVAAQPQPRAAVAGRRETARTRARRTAK